MFEGTDEVLVERVGLLSAPSTGDLLCEESRPLLVGIGELRVRGPDLHPGDQHVEVLRHPWRRAMGASERGNLAREVLDERGLEDAPLGALLVDLEHDLPGAPRRVDRDPGSLGDLAEVPPLEGDLLADRLRDGFQHSDPSPFAGEVQRLPLIVERQRSAHGQGGGLHQRLVELHRSPRTPGMPRAS